MPQERTDGWANFFTGMGVATRDKRLGAQVERAPDLTQYDLTELYAGDALAQRICDLPAREQTREWITFSSDADAKVAKGVLQALQVLGAQDAVTDALSWARLYGGAVMLVGADDGQDPTQPLNEKAIQTFRWLTVLDRHALEVVSRYENALAPKYGQPEVYKIVSRLASGRASENLGREIHETRVLRFDGVRTPRERLERNSGWCDSIFTALFAVVRDFWTGYDGAAHLLTDFSQAVFKVKGLANLIASNQGAVVLQRMQIADMVRSILRAVVIDADGEDFTRQGTPVAGMPELLDRLQQLVAGVTEIPVSLLMGRAPAGLNATGDADIRFFYDNVRSLQESKLRPKLERLLTLLLRAKDGPTRGIEPPNWSFKFRPLWQLTEKEQAEVRKIQAETDAIYVSNDIVGRDEIRQSRFGGDAYSTETTLDPALEAADLVQAADPDAEDEGEEGVSAEEQ